MLCQAKGVITYFIVEVTWVLIQTNKPYLPVGKTHTERLDINVKAEIICET